MSILLSPFATESDQSRRGCTTFLKTIAGETDGFKLTPDSYLNYQGISPKNMHSQFRGEAIYTAEVDVHFPQMSVGETLYFAANARAPRNAPGGVSRQVYADHMAKMMMAVFGISHTINTKGSLFSTLESG